MKYLGKAKKILGMQIERDEKKDELKISQKTYVYRVLDRFGTSEAKPALTIIAQLFKLSHKQCPNSEEETEYMNKVPYTNAVGSIMFSMICTKPDLAFAASFIALSCLILEENIGMQLNGY